MKQIIARIVWGKFYVFLFMILTHNAWSQSTISGMISDENGPLPGATVVVKNKGIHIPKIEGDEKGLYLSFPLREDILGNTIIGVPDIGAIELD